MRRIVSRSPLRLSIIAAALAACPIVGWADGPSSRPAIPPGVALPDPGLPANIGKSAIGPSLLDKGGILNGQPIIPPTPDNQPLPLDERPFERVAAGISVRAPLGWNGIVEPDREEIVRFVDDLKKQNRSLVITRRSFPTPQNLFAAKDAKGELVNGIVENTLKALENELPNSKVLRAGDPTNVGSHDVGMIVIRYTRNGERRLAQHAIIQANNQLFYLVAYNTPARKDVVEDLNPEEKTVDPSEQASVQTFRNVVDSIKLLDLRPVREDQTERLFRTRNLFVNLTEQRINSVLVPERYLRIMKYGKDIGYSYVVEKAGIRARTPGVNIGIRTRLLTMQDPMAGKPASALPSDVGLAAAGKGGAPENVIRLPGKVVPFPREDSESSMFATVDRRIEEWSKVTVWDDDGSPKTEKNPFRKASEVGSSSMQVRRVASVKPADPLRPDERTWSIGVPGDKKQPWVEDRQDYSLTVQFKATRGDLDPITRPLPPFYLPQAIGTLLPRLVPANEPKTYLVATYVTDVRQVMLRYIDVRREEALPAEISRVTGIARGIPVDDRIGYEGAITTHYVTTKGDYLGSINKKSGITVVPTDEQTLKTLYGVAETTKLFEIAQDTTKGLRVKTGDKPMSPNPGPDLGPRGDQLINPTGGLPGQLK